MTSYLLGANGRLGQALLEVLGTESVTRVDRSTYEPWGGTDGEDQVSAFLDTHDIDASTVIFVAAGLLNPRLPAEDLNRANYQLPKNVIESAAERGIKVVTFGTVMERLLRTKNPYIQSKTSLGRYVAEVSSAGVPVTHLQIHTLFGLGTPSDFMFLGQMLAALKNGDPFRMTSGRQLREYHHYIDEARAIQHVAVSDTTGVINLSHGKPLSLRAIATAVFDELGDEGLLRIGDLPEPPDENYDEVLVPTLPLDEIHFRDSLPAIVEHMREHCDSA